MDKLLYDSTIVYLVLGLGMAVIMMVTLYEIPCSFLMALGALVVFGVSLFVRIRMIYAKKQRLRNGKYVVGYLIPEPIRVQRIGREMAEVQVQVRCLDEESGKAELFKGTAMLSGSGILEQIKKIKEVRVVYLEEDHSVYHVFFAEETEKLGCWYDAFIVR